MDYVYQNIEVFQRWIVLCGVGVGLAVAGEAIVHSVVRKIKEWFNERR